MHGAHKKAVTLFSVTAGFSPHKKFIFTGLFVFQDIGSVVRGLGKTDKRVENFGIYPK